MQSKVEVSKTFYENEIEDYRKREIANYIRVAAILKNGTEKQKEASARCLENADQLKKYSLDVLARFMLDDMILNYRTKQMEAEKND